MSLPAELSAWVEEEAARTTEGRVSPVLRQALYAYREQLERREAAWSYLDELDRLYPIPEAERRRLEEELEADLAALG